MYLIVNGATTYRDPSAPVAIASGDDLVVGWDPISQHAGIGNETIGNEHAGIGATLPHDIRYTVIEILDPSTGEVVATSDPLLPPTDELAYWSEDNIFDHDGSYETDMIFRVVQLDRSGRRTVIGTIETT